MSPLNYQTSSALRLPVAPLVLSLLLPLELASGLLSAEEETTDRVSTEPPRNGLH
jgi:hypothetical protein